ncbi:mitochondrial Rho GTPase 2 [Tanacetum coccineum]
MCSLEGKAKLEEELKRADVVVLTYACDKPETFSSLQIFWFQEIRRLKFKFGNAVYVILKQTWRPKVYQLSIFYAILIACFDIIDNAADLIGKVPVIVVGCKLDLAYEQYPMSREQVISPIWLQYREIEAFIECSVANLAQICKAIEEI